MRQLNRVQPIGPAAAYKTYELSAPLATHSRPATCEEVDCRHRREGWQSRIDTATELGARQMRYIRDHSGRRYTDVTGDDFVPIRTLVFPPGQRCFRQHHVPLEREPLLIVRGGDWRGNPTGHVRRHVRAAEWVEDFAEHQDHIATRRQRG